jgi:hypothetical protein
MYRNENESLRLRTSGSCSMYGRGNRSFSRNTREQFYRLLQGLLKKKTFPNRNVF